MQTPAEVVEGLVEKRNDTGVRVQGQWFNQSKFRHVELPEVGEFVRISSDTKGFLMGVDVLDDMPAHPEVSNAAVRLAVLRIAAGFASSRPEARSADVLPLAEKWLDWVQS